MTFLRALFFLLLIANIVFVVAGNSLPGASTGRGEPERLAAQIEPQKIKLARPEAAGIQPRAATAPAATAKEENVPAPSPAQKSCVVLLGLSPDQSQALQDELRQQTKLAVAERVLEEPTAWWVIIPSQGDRQQMAKRSEELKSQGVDNFISTEEGPNKNAISLALFKSESKAQTFLRQVQAKGVQDARILARSPVGGRRALDVRGESELVSSVTDRALASYPAVKRGECEAP